MNRRSRFSAVVRGIGKGMDPTRVMGRLCLVLPNSEQGLVRDWNHVAGDLYRAIEGFDEESPHADISALVARDTIAISPSSLRRRRPTKTNEDA